METAAALTTTASRRPAAAAAAACARHGQRGAAAAVFLQRRRKEPRAGRLRALPPELSEILSPKLVPGSPADTGDVSSLLPVSALMLLFYFVSNWLVPELLMKRLDKPEDEAAASMSPFSADAADGGQADGGASARGKIRPNKAKGKKKRKPTVVEV